VVEPKATVHKQRDLPLLKACTREAEALILSLPCASELKDDINLAVKGIVTEASRMRKQKPILCLDNDVYDYTDLDKC
jgi:hypothetical protein